MGLFFGRKKAQREAAKSLEEAKKQDTYSSVEVTQLKRRTHQTAEDTTKEIDKLNNLLKANGITLKIHIASGGHRGR